MSKPFILTRAALVALHESGECCLDGIGQHAVRAHRQQLEGVEGANGIDTVYPDGFTLAEWRRITADSPRFAWWLMQHHVALGIPRPTRAAVQAVQDGVRAAAKGKVGR